LSAEMTRSPAVSAIHRKQCSGDAINIKFNMDKLAALR